MLKINNRQLHSEKDADDIVEAVTRSATRAVDQIMRLPLSAAALRTLWPMKTEPVGYDPLNSDVPQNLIEQINQTFTCLASARAVKVLLSRHPEFIPFTQHLGTVPGSDIESLAQGGLAAEVFTAVSTENNWKLEKDIQKVGATIAQRKYAFFMCPGYVAGRHQRLETRPDMEVWSVGAQLGALTTAWSPCAPLAAQAERWDIKEVTSNALDSIGTV